MTNCKFCGIEVVSTGDRPRIFCSDRCRKASKRTEQADKILQTDIPVIVTNEHIDETLKAPLKVDDVTKLSKDELYMAIDSYPHDTWKDSKEYAELTRRLKTTPASKLEAQGYYIPNKYR